MRIGVPKEIKDHETRVALTPAGVASLVGRGHAVTVQRGAGAEASFLDADYSGAGAAIGSADDCWRCELVVKVKEPLPDEHARLQGQIVFTYFHLAANSALTEALLSSRTTAVAYETVEDALGRLPLLAPMSAVAGTMAPIVAAHYLARAHGGRGVLLGRMLGRSHGKVTIAGDGVVGQHAAQIAVGLGARVVVLGWNRSRAGEIARISSEIEYEDSNEAALSRHLPDSDVFIGAALVKGARTPHLVTEAMVRSMPRGSVIVDVSIDQGGCVETSRPTSHSDPVFVEHGVTHYCVTNMPGAYPRTSTVALADATLPYVERLADGGIRAVVADAAFAKGINTYGGHITCAPVAEALGLQDRYSDVEALAAVAGARPARI